MDDISRAASIMGKKGGSVKSPRKAITSAANGKKRAGCKQAVVVSTVASASEPPRCPYCGQVMNWGEHHE